MSDQPRNENDGPEDDGALGGGHDLFGGYSGASGAPAESAVPAEPAAPADAAAPAEPADVPAAPDAQLAAPIPHAVAEQLTAPIPPAAQAASAAAPRANGWFSAFTAPVLLGALSHVGIAIGAAFLGGALLTLLMLTSADNLLSSVMGGSIEDIVNVGGVVVNMMILFTAFIYGGEISGHASGGGFFEGSGSIWFFPLTLTVAALVAVLWWGVRQARAHPLPTLMHRVVYALGVGLVTGILLLILAAIFSFRIEQSGVGAQITAAGYRVVLFSTILVGGAAYLGQWAGTYAVAGESWIGTVIRAFRALPRVVREVLVYTAFGTVVFSVIGALLVIVSGWDSSGPAILGVALVGLLSVAPFAAAIGHLSAATSTMGFGMTSETDAMSVFGGTSPLTWLLVLVTLLFSVFVALWIGARRVRTAGIQWQSAWLLPVVVFGAWLIPGNIFTGFGGVMAGSAGIMGGGGGGFGYGIALWSPFIFAIWAFAVEIGAQTLPRLLYGIAPKALGALAGKKAAAAWVAGPSAVPAATGLAPTAVYQGAVAPAVDGAGQPAAPGYPGYAAPGEPAATPAPAPLSPKAKRGLLIGGISFGALILLLVGGGVAISVMNSGRSPEAVVQRYLEHIAAGEAEAANKMVNPNIGSEQRQFLTDEVLGAASERISDIETSRLSSDGDTAYVNVSYSLDGVSQEAMLEVRKGEPEMLVLDTWNVKDSLARSVDIMIEGQGIATIGGVEIPYDEADYGYTQITMYPGIYPVEAGDSPYFALPDTTVSVGGPYSSTEISFEPTPALQDEVEKQVGALLDECLTRTDARPEGCPFSVYTFKDDTKVTWTMDEEPTVEIEDSGSAVTVEGTAIGSYTETFLSTPRDYSDKRSIYMIGEIVIDGDKVSVDFDDSWW